MSELTADEKRGILALLDALHTEDLYFLNGEVKAGVIKGHKAWVYPLKKPLYLSEKKKGDTKKGMAIIAVAITCNKKVYAGMTDVDKFRRTKKPEMSFKEARLVQTGLCPELEAILSEMF